MKRWVVVANQSGARIFSAAASGAGLIELEDAFNPRGRARDGDIDADRPGRSFDSAGDGRHALGREETPSEHAAADFARHVAARLAAARSAAEFDSLVLVAEPRFLGRLRAALDDPTAATVSASLDKDLVRLDAGELLPHVREAIRPSRM